MKTVLILLTASVVVFTWWFNKPVYVQENLCKIEDLVNDPKAVEKAIQKMGPYYQYTVEPDGVLKVKLNGKWLELKY